MKLSSSIVSKMNFRKRELKYKLCSETSMENENNYLYKIKIPLNKLYCIDNQYIVFVVFNVFKYFVP